MNPKIEKLNAEFQKNTDKIASLKARNKEISRNSQHDAGGVCRVCRGT